MTGGGDGGLETKIEIGTSCRRIGWVGLDPDALVIFPPRRSFPSGPRFYEQHAAVVADSRDGEVGTLACARALAVR